MLNADISVIAQGYMVLYALAEDNLKLGLPVVADCVNPLPVTREAWHDVAQNGGSECLDVEVICSDVAEHQRRVEVRHDDESNRSGSWETAHLVAGSGSRLSALDDAAPAIRHGGANAPREF